MSVERRSQVIPASGVIEAPRGNIFLLLSSTVAVNLRLSRGGSDEGFNNITGGIRIRRIVPWDLARIIGAAGGTVEFIVGDEKISEDDVDIFLQVTAIAGTIATTVTPSSALASIADNALAAGGTETIAANLTRKRITVGCVSTNVEGFRIKPTGAGANHGIEVQPGQFVEIATTAALDVTAPGAATSYYWLEES